MNPQFSEGWALISNSYGMKATGIFSGMKYGPKSQNAINKVLELAPENPRVAMIHGIGLMHKPAIVGGSVEKAINTFKEAVKYFEHWEIFDPLYPEWGEAENYVWLAQAYIDQKRMDAAQKAYQSAIEISPDNYLIREVLMPELREQMSTDTSR